MINCVKCLFKYTDTPTTMYKAFQTFSTKFDAWVDEDDGDSLDSLGHLRISINIDNEWMSDLLEHRGNTLCVEEVTPGG